MVSKIFSLTIIVFLVTQHFSYSQSLSAGFRVEPTVMLIEKQNENSVSFTAYSLYGTLSYSTIENIQLEIRPGYIIGGDYTGFDFGGFIRYKIHPSKIFLVAGINNHSNDILNSHNSGGSIVKKMLFTGFGVGYQKDSKLSIDIMYYWTDDKTFAYSYDNINSKRYDRKMNGIIKAGFCLSWDIL